MPEEIRHLEKSNRQEIVVDDPIYTEYSVEGIDKEDIAKFIYGAGHFDAYCTECEKESVFLIGNSYVDISKKADELSYRGTFSVEAKCSRYDEESWSPNCEGRLISVFYRNHDKVVKIGQHPSKGDLDFGSLDPVFNTELDPPLRKELGTAVGLRAHGVGIGSFVYMRRIFERLIDEAHEQMKDGIDWDEEKFKKARMPERIKLLAPELPNRLVESASLYSIMSKGIHELGEEECLDHFDLVFGAIRSILKESHEEKKYQEIVNRINQEYSKIEDDSGE